MFDVLRLTVIPLMALLGWGMARRNRECARRLVRPIPVTIGGILLVMAVEGWSPRQAAFAEWHRWLGHILLAGAWLLAPFALGLAIEQARRRPWMAAAQVIVVVLLLGLLLLCSFTGYLPAGPQDNVGEETRHRFLLLHQVALPVLAAMLAAVWFWLLAPPRTDRPESRNRPASNQAE